MYYNNTQALMLLGHICNNLGILRNADYTITDKTFNTKMHKLLFRVANNLSLNNDIQELDATTIKNYLSKYEEQNRYFRENSGEEIVENP